MTQLVPSQTSCAHAPSVAGKMVLPATFPSIGTTLLTPVALFTAFAVMVLIVNILPVLLAGVGNVILQVPAKFTMIYVVASPTVYVAAVTVTGARWSK